MQPTTNQQVEPFASMALKEIAEILVKEKKLHKGLFDLSFEFQIAVGGIGPSPESIAPGVMISLSRIGLVKAQQLGPHTVDAALVNPIKKPAKKQTPIKEK